MIESAKAAVNGLCPIVALTPFGLSGPYANFKGPEAITAAFGGVTYAIGEEQREPLRPPGRQGLVQSGLAGAIVALAAVHAFKSNQGADPTAATGVVDISEADIWATLHMGTTLVAYLFGNRIRKRSGNRVAGQPFPHQLFECADGWIAVQASERHQFEAFPEMLGNPTWLADRELGSRSDMNRSVWQRRN